jgi:hypothetical protein
MSQQVPLEPDSSGDQPAQPADWREQRREWKAQRREERHEWRDQFRQERREMRSQGAWIMGLALVGLGVVFLLQNMGMIDLRNWWALFIMLPALGSFSEAWGRYHTEGRLTAAARGSLLAGLFFTLLAAIFLFGWNSGLIWPVLIILVGAGILLNALLPG